MAEPRGPTGEVSGLPPEQVRRILTPLAAEIRDKDGGRFTRAGLRERIEERTGLGEEVAENLVTAFLRSSGAFREGPGDWRLPPDAEGYVRHRDWRLHVGRIGAADVAALVGMMDQHSASLTPRLADVWARLAAGLRSIDLGPIRPVHRREDV